MKTFSFNLIPRKEKEVVVKEEKRDSLSIFTAFLPLIGVVIWLFLTVFNGVVVSNSKTDWLQSVANKKSLIDNDLLAVREQHGELVIKTKMLSDLIMKDVKPENLFILTEKIFPTTEQGVRIVGYGRRTDGSFDIYLETENYQKLSEIARRFSSYKGSSKVNLSTASSNPPYVNGTINFNLNVEFIEQDK